MRLIKRWSLDRQVNAQQSPRGVLNDIVEIFELHDTDNPTNTRKFEDDIEALQSREICGRTDKSIGPATSLFYQTQRTDPSSVKAESLEIKVISSSPAVEAINLSNGS